MPLPYNKTILYHGKNPGNFHILTHPTATYELKSPLCGDRLHLMLEIENDVIIALGWQGEGCAISQSTASLLGEFILDKPLNEVRAITDQDVIQMLGIPLTPNRQPCATLAHAVLQKCLNAI